MLSFPSTLQQVTKQYSRSQQETLDVFFSPKTVALFGVTPDPEDIGFAIMRNLVRHPFGGTIYPISRQVRDIHGIKAYADLGVTPTQVELALIAAPSEEVPELVAECVAEGVKGAIIYSAHCGKGPKPVLSTTTLDKLQAGTLRILGPNTIGLACSATGLNATFAPGMIQPGTIGMISQSSALLYAMLNEEVPQRLGCSAFVSLGSVLDTNWADWIRYLGNDPHTQCIGIYLETLRETADFFSAVREVTPRKPVLILRAGRTTIGKKPTVEDNWTGRREEYLEEAFRHVGALRVATISEMYRMADMLASQSHPPGRRLAILSNARGPAMLASDYLLTHGGELAPLAPATISALQEKLKGQGSATNPIDIGNAASADRLAQAAKLAALDPQSDALLIMVTPEPTMDPAVLAENLLALSRQTKKPIFIAWLWGAGNSISQLILRHDGIRSFSSVEMALDAFDSLWRHGDNFGSLHEMQLPVREQASSVTIGQEILEQVNNAGRKFLKQSEIQDLLSAYSLPTKEMLVADSPQRAVDIANQLDYPVALRLHLEGKQVEGEVKLHANSAEAVSRTFHMLESIARYQFEDDTFRGVQVEPLLHPARLILDILGTTDPELGPIVEVTASSAHDYQPPVRLIAIAPLPKTRIQQMVQQVKRYAEEYPHRRSMGNNPQGLETFLERFSQLLADNPSIKAMSIGSLIPCGDFLIPGSTQVELSGRQTKET